MRNLLYTFVFTSLILFSFTLPGEESIYEGTKVSYKVEKENSVVVINLDLMDPNDFQEIVIMRSDNPSEYFRSIKELSKDQISQLGKENVLLDKYPLPSTMVSYYKVQTIDKFGVQRSYPSVKLASK
jgi:hypothetical protein